MGDIYTLKELLKIVNGHNNDYTFNIGDFEYDLADFVLNDFQKPIIKPKILKNGIPENWENETSL